MKNHVWDTADMVDMRRLQQQRSQDIKQSDPVASIAYSLVADLPRILT